ncbi:MULTISPECIES: homoserine kinase [unclassified Oceanobacter]|uniref:homoserine kinase n=1 Tax=unclassified Oceanobacter TaxID=2620260 RepID=UPI002734EA3D|nr:MULTISPECIES: homoserine kinase [unclassified Oceanobacter]MDP2607892.1 homoserine kinase [Oceanobacter sp. 1_MG-2023]MDP2610924.1 homoserine kinase [Oceanobacter sp. 2_MG-2023]
MSVYTPVPQSTLAVWLEQFELGSLLSLRGIAGGIENTNYFVTTTAGEFVLTLFEHHAADEVEQFVALANHLGRANAAGQSSSLPVPAPIANRDGQWLFSLEHKPAILCPRLAGEHVEHPTASHARQAAAGLAQLHLAAADLNVQRPNSRSLDWWTYMAGTLTHVLNEADMALLRDEIQQQQQIRGDWLALPHGWIHGDLFHDNVLFENTAAGPKLGAILDLYNACQDAWIFDLAIAANDWCCDSHGNWQYDLLEALLEGYQSVRPFTEAEQALWPMALRGAALRFWLSRILTQQLQSAQLTAADGQMAISKDPAEYRDKLCRRRQAAQPAA